MQLSNGLNFGSFFLGFLAFFGILVTCGVPYWSISNWQTSDALYGRIPTFNGIWWKCMSLKTGGFSCNNYGKPSIYLSADIQACRALICIATITSFLGMLISLLGLNCTTIIEADTKPKYMASLVAGFMFLTAALTCCASVSWYAWRVTMEYHNPFYQEREFKYQYGACLYIGWVSMLLALVAGVILTTGSCGSMKNYSGHEDYSHYDYKATARMPVKKEKAEYV